MPSYYTVINPFTAILFFTFMGVVSGYPQIPKGATFQLQLQDEVDTSVEADVFDIDLFDYNVSTIKALKNLSKTVICYFSAGSQEAWRGFNKKIPTSVLGDHFNTWLPERWWDIRTKLVRNIIIDRLNLAAEKGCDGVEPDNVNAFQVNGGGLNITESDEESFLKWLSAQAHKRNLSIGLRNVHSLTSRLNPYFDWQLVDECFDFEECDKYISFLQSGKAVFHMEYVDRMEDGARRYNEICDNVPIGFTTIIKQFSLDAWRIPCD